jgi:hypothetical protein
MYLKPTYSTKEALLLMCELDLEGLKILRQVIKEEKDRYSIKDLDKLHKVHKYCVLTEKRNKGSV